MREILKIDKSWFGLLFLLLIVLPACAGSSESVGVLSESASSPIPVGTTEPTVVPTRTTPAQRSTAVATVTAVVATPTPTAEHLATKTPTPQPGATLPPIDDLAQEPYIGIWISRAELSRLPMIGPAWEQILATAQKNSSSPDLNDQNDIVNMRVLAKALVFARTGEENYREKVVDSLEVITYENTEKGGSTLALGRELLAYVVAADLINLPEYAPQFNEDFEEKLLELLTKQLDDDRSLRATHEERPNNWGTHAGATRAAIARYLGDTEELRRTAQVFKGWLGDRETYAGFIYGDDLSWQCDPERPVGVNPKGCEKEGHIIDGSQPEEMRRGDEFQWPPEETGYAWEALQGALAQAEILYRAGYDVWEWEDQALLRAVQFLYNVGWEPGGDDEWQVWLVNHAYCAEFPTVAPARPGKNIGWTDWTHAGGLCGDTAVEDGSD